MAITGPRRLLAARGLRWLAAAGLVMMIAPVGCNPARGCVESSFQLKASSRLPRWFGDAVAAEDRSQFTLVMSYFMAFIDVDNVVVELRHIDGSGKETRTGKSCWHPATRWSTLSDGTVAAAPEPHYMIITVAGVTEVVEHNGGEGFTLSDDPQLIRQALDSLARGECRGSPDVDPAPSAP